MPQFQAAYRNPCVSPYWLPQAYVKLSLRASTCVYMDVDVSLYASVHENVYVRASVHG